MVFQRNIILIIKLKKKLWLPFWYGCYANETNLVECINHI